jgi:hypothetical protein
MPGEETPLAGSNQSEEEGIEKNERATYRRKETLLFKRCDD